MFKVLILASIICLCQGERGPRDSSPTSGASIPSVTQGSNRPDYHNQKPFYDKVERRWICPQPLTTTPTTTTTTTTTKSTIAKSMGRTGPVLLEALGVSHTAFPLNLAMQLNKMSDVNEIYKLLTNGSEPKALSSVSHDVTRMSGSFTGLKKGLSGGFYEYKMAKCLPELTVVNLDVSEGPGFAYYPSCLRIERCGGCCHNDLLTCQPTKKEQVKIKVLKVETRGIEIGDYTNNRLQPIWVEKHTNCTCACKIKEQDCKSFEKYLEQECRCTCKNEDAKRDCEGKQEKHEWDGNNCRCMCRKTTECSTGKIFNHKTCSCSINDDGRVKELINNDSEN